MGIIIEAASGMYAGMGFFHQLAHQSLYICLLFVGICAILESKRFLFPDVGRYALSGSFLFQYILWREHALMKTEAIDARIHMIQAEINFFAFVIFAYSVLNPKSVFVYIASWSTLTLNGMWIFTCGLIQSGYCGIMLHTVGAVIVLEGLFLATLIVATSVCILPPSTYNIEGRETSYASIAPMFEIS